MTRTPDQIAKSTLLSLLTPEQRKSLRENSYFRESYRIFYAHRYPVTTRRVGGQPICLVQSDLINNRRTLSRYERLLMLYVTYKFNPKQQYLFR